MLNNKLFFSSTQVRDSHLAGAAKTPDFSVQVDDEDIEDGQKDGEDVIVQNFDDEQTSDETDSSSSSEKD